MPTTAATPATSAAGTGSSPRGPRRAPVPTASFDLLGVARHGLAEAATAGSAGERYAAAHLSALRAAAAVLASRARPAGGRRGPRSVWVVLPQVAQGALAVECRDDDDDTQKLVAGIDDAAAHAAVDAERAFLRQLGGGCDLPCGALATTGSDGRLSIDVLLATHDGTTVLRLSHRGDDPEQTGTEAGRILLEDLGGRDLLRGTDR